LLIFLILLGLLVAVGVVAVRREMLARARTGIETLMGKPGRAKEDFSLHLESYTGIVFVDGARWQSTCSEPVFEGDTVEIVSVLREPTRLVVKRQPSR